MASESETDACDGGLNEIGFQLWKMRLEREQTNAVVKTQQLHSLNLERAQLPLNVHNNSSGMPRWQPLNGFKVAREKSVVSDIKMCHIRKPFLRKCNVIFINKWLCCSSFMNLAVACEKSPTNHIEKQIERAECVSDRVILALACLHFNSICKWFRGCRIQKWKTWHASDAVSF